MLKRLTRGAPTQFEIAISCGGHIGTKGVIGYYLDYHSAPVFMQKYKKAFQRAILAIISEVLLVLLRRLGLSAAISLLILYVLRIEHSQFSILLPLLSVLIFLQIAWLENQVSCSRQFLKGKYEDENIFIHTLAQCFFQEADGKGLSLEAGSVFITIPAGSQLWKGHFKWVMPNYAFVFCLSPEVVRYGMYKKPSIHSYYD